MLSIALGRPLGIEGAKRASAKLHRRLTPLDADCDVELPLAIDDDYLPAYFKGADIDSTNPSLMGGFIALISLTKLGGQILRSVYSIDKSKARVHSCSRLGAELNLVTG